MLPLLLGLVAISGLGALITCLASRFTMMMKTLMVMFAMMVTRVAFHNNADDDNDDDDVCNEI